MVQCLYYPEKELFRKLKNKYVYPVQETDFFVILLWAIIFSNKEKWKV